MLSLLQLEKNNDNKQREISDVGSEKDNVYINLTPLPYEGRETVSNRPSAKEQRNQLEKEYAR